MPTRDINDADVVLLEEKNQLEADQAKLKADQGQVKAEKAKLKAEQAKLKAEQARLDKDRETFHYELGKVTPDKQSQCRRIKVLGYVLRNQRGTEPVGSGSDNRARDISSIVEISRLSMVSPGMLEISKKEKFLNQEKVNRERMTYNLKQAIEAVLDVKFANNQINNQTLDAIVTSFGPQTHSDFSFFPNNKGGIVLWNKGPSITTTTIQKKRTPDTRYLPERYLEDLYLRLNHDYGETFDVRISDREERLELVASLVASMRLNALRWRGSDG